MDNSYDILTSKLLRSGKFSHLNNTNGIEKAVLLEATVEYVDLLERELSQYRNSPMPNSTWSSRPMITSTPLGGHAVPFSSLGHFWHSSKFPNSATPPSCAPHIQNCLTVKMPSSERPLDLSRSFLSASSSDLGSSVISNQSVTSKHETIFMRSETDSSGYQTNSLGSSISSESSANDDSTNWRRRDCAPKKRLIFDLQDLDGPGQSDSESASIVGEQDPRESFQKRKTNLPIWRPYG